jgi:hypothetical protein
MCNENAARAENQSSDHCPSEFDNPEEGNTAHEDCQQIYRKHTSDISTQRSAGKSVIACACPDIFNFETYRDANRFAVGQIWALYDKLDVMPRFYARIMHFDAHNHKIHLTWLEHEATNEEEENWTNKKLPIACGSFRLQPTVDTSQDRFMFSHIVAWTKGKKGNSYDIYPNKGEVWALYKGWNKQWSSDTDNHRSCEYEVVEVLSNMSADDGATVIPLVKIKDFVSLFARSKGMSSFFIPSSELLRFSHSISFYRTNGNEKNGVPRGFLELDTACLPADLDAAFSSVTLVSYMFLGNMTGSVFADLTTEGADNKMDCGDELARNDNSLEQNICHSICTDDTDNISFEQNPSEQKKAHDANELGTEDTSTMPNAAGSCDLQMLGKRKHDDCADSGRRRDSCINKRQSKDTADKMYNDDVAVANTQAAKHVPDTMDSQGEGNATHEDCQQKYKEEATDIANQTHGNPGIAYECTGSIRSRDSRNNDKQRKDNSLADTNSTDDNVCSDNVAGGKNQAAEPVHSTLDSQDDGNVTQEGSQQKYKKDGMDIANHKHCNPVITDESSDFFDFGTLRDVNRIAVNEIWAIYDDHDSMPRNYAQINDVDASNNIVQLTWLEHNTTNLQETRWNRKELPVACGNFCLGETCVLHDPSMYFSHKVSWVTGKNRNSFEIHPKKGEIWALYKESSLLQSRDTDNHQSVDYDVVEVSDDSMSVGIIVFPLVRIEGFVRLFAESKDKSRILIPSSELLRFSHSIPCYRTNGSEKVGVGGLLELDTAALPCDLATMFPSVTLDSFIDLNKKKVTEFVGVTYPDSEFYNFDEDRLCEKFERGQIWALYSSTDTFPNLYGWINKVEKEPFNVHLTWLKACSQGLDKHWLEQDIPVSCGNFVTRNSTTEHCETCAFSHLVVSRCEIGTRQQVSIFPKVGEVWAIYKNWAPNWVPSSKDRPANYAIGWIKMCTEATTLFAFLTKVNSHLSVFKHDVLKPPLEIPREENLRFSHRIPSFRLTKDNGGKLCGFYELDPAAVPDVLL